MGVNLILKLLADHFEADRKHAKIVEFSFSSKAGSQASQKRGGTTQKSDPPDAENRVRQWGALIIKQLEYGTN